MTNHRKGGALAATASRVAGAGRGGDSVLVHMNPQEYSALQQSWGRPTVNPKTGQPEYFLSGLQKWFSENPWASVALPLASSALGVGNLVGSGISSLTDGAISGSTANALGGALTGATLGGITGGSSGALTGGLLGGISPYVMSAMGYNGDGLLGGLFGGSTPGDGANGLNDAAYRADGSPLPPERPSDLKSTLASQSLGSMASMSKMLPLMMAGAALASAAGGSKKNSGSVQSAQAQDPNMTRPLSQVEFKRTPTNTSIDNPTDYGQAAGQHRFYNNNSLPGLARGGTPPTAPTQSTPLQQAAPPQQDPNAETGRADNIPARLSPGEYVMDAETVAMLGDGNGKAGAARLDEMRSNIRRHKGKALAKGKISPNAKRPDAYMKGP